ncbi:hypothetical protein FRC12_014366 [Ceratobasidium sp. 428]|nr:hypothetical protein FRC12_014366 [Ceratobasidium sp. 428]
MAQAQVGPYLKPGKSAPYSLNSGLDLERVLNNWVLQRGALTVAVQGFLAACSDLVTSCAAPHHHPSRERRIAVILSLVDAGLASLASEEAALHRASTSLKVARNQSKVLSPIRMLPPEILADIFLMAHRRSSSYDEFKYYLELNRMSPAQAIAETSSYWRQVAISTPSLWTDVRINAGQIWYGNAVSSLNRTNGAPIHLTIFEPDGENTDIHWSWESLHKPSKFFRQACQQIHGLHIYSRAYANDTTEIVLKHWLDHCSAGVTKVLRIQRPEAVLSLDTPPPLDWDFDLESTEHAEAVLTSISVLQLESTLIPWASTAYHNLADLRLYYECAQPNRVQISASEFANILNSSPRLVRLQLENLDITSSDDWVSTTMIRPVHLEVLYLCEMSRESYQHLLSLVSLSDCLNDLSVSLRIRQSDEVADLIQGFFRNVRIKTLICSGIDEHPDSQYWAWSLSAMVASLSNLVLNELPLYETEVQAIIGERQTSPDQDTPHGQIAPCLPHLFMRYCDVNIEGLKLIVSAYGVENLHLDRCLVDNAEISGSYLKGMGELRSQLLDVFPNLVCVVSNGGATAEWPWVKRFD